MKKMLDIKAPENLPSLYCNEKAVITIAGFLGRNYAMAFSEMNGIEYLENDEALRIEDRMRATYSEVAIVKALSKYHGISSYFPVKTQRTIIRAIEEQIEANLPMLIFLSYSTCYHPDERDGKIDFLVVGFDEDNVYGYDMHAESAQVLKIPKHRIKEDYGSREKVITWKVIHDEVLITKEIQGKILKTLSKELRKEQDIIARFASEIEKNCFDVDGLKRIDFETLLENLAQIVRAKKLFVYSMRYIAQRTPIPETIIASYEGLSMQWNKVWQLIAKVNYMSKDRTYDDKLLHFWNMALSEMKKIMDNEKCLEDMLVNAKEE